MTDDPGKMTDADWWRKLTPAQYQVLRERGTEPQFSGEYVHEHADGMYHCAACGAALFSSETKFDSTSGWPSFTEPALIKSVNLQPDDSHGLRRIEVTCARCGGHLGHVFDDGPAGRGGKRYCINSAALAFRQRAAG